MRKLTLILVAVMIATTMAVKGTGSEFSEIDKTEMEEMKKRFETDPAFRREVEAQLEEKLQDLPATERTEAKKRFWGLWGLGLFNPLFWLLGKRETTVQPEIKRTTATERDMKELEEMKKRFETDPAFRREVEAQLEEKLEDLPASERAEAKKRFWGLWGLGLWNPWFWLLGKRDTTMERDGNMKREDFGTKFSEKLDKKSMDTASELDEVKVTVGDMDKKALTKRFWGLWGLPWLYGFPYFGLWGKKRSMEAESMPAIDRDIMEKREEEFKRFEEAEKRLQPELYKREGETYTIEEVKEMKKRWWGLGYGYGLGLGYGWGLGYPWGFWGKRDTMPDTKRDDFVDKEMMKRKREEAYDRLLRDL